MAETEARLAVVDARVRARPTTSEVAVLCPCRIREPEGVENDR
jgi:hypothetical protein